MTFHQFSESAKKWLLAAALLTAPTAAYAEDAAEETASAATISVGADPSQAKYSGSSDGEAPPLTIRTSTQDWEFGYHGYFRAPMSMSWDRHKTRAYELNADGSPRLDANGEYVYQDPYKDYQFNMKPKLPDGTYTDWKYTNNVAGPWAEMVFSYGNSIAVGNVSVATYNISDGSWRNLQSQLGIDSAFVTLNFPRAFGAKGGLFWNVGIFANRYGMAGRYDGGRFDTYIFGRTHVAGETLTAKLDLTSNLVLVLEHGFGAKADILPGNPKLDYDPNNEGNTFAWIPYAGIWGQTPAMVNHAHGGLVFHTHALFKELLINAHFIHAFSNTEDKTDDGTSTPYHMPDGKQMISGLEIKANGAIFGDAYLGYSHASTDGLARMPDAVELLHSQGGWMMLKNFYGDQTLRDDDTSGLGRNGDPNPGTGKIDTIAWQYMFSLSRLLWHLQGKEFWGQGPDLQITTWGMLNLVNPDDDLRPYLKRWAEKKLKVGAEVMYTPLQYLGFGFRFDRVMPDLDYDENEDERNSGSVSSYAPFTVLSPKLRIKTAFITHEEVNIQYSRYLWNGARNDVRAENPYEREDADRNAFMLSVNIWW